MKPQTLRSLVKEWKSNRAHTYSSENADRYRGFDDAQRGDATQLENRIIAFEQEIDRMIAKAISARKIELLNWFKEYVLGERP